MGQNQLVLDNQQSVRRKWALNPRFMVLLLLMIVTICCYYYVPHSVEFYLYPTVGTVLIHSIKPELTE